MTGRRPRVLMLLENNAYPQDVRVRLEAQSLTGGGYAVTVIAPRIGRQPRREVVEGVTVRRFSLPRTSSTPAGIAAEYAVANLQLYLRACTALLRGVEIVHLHNPPDTLFGVSLCARALGRHVVYDMHDLAPELFAAKFGGGWMVSVLGRLERCSARSAHRIVTVNQSLRELVSRRDGVPVERIGLVANAPPTAMLSEAKPARGGELTDPRLVFVGNIESQDGVELLPELVRMVRDERGLSGVRLTVAGDGSARREAEARCRDAGVQDSVEFIGRVRHESVAGILAGADICLEPAPRNEHNDRCSMVKVYEYMAAGRPIVGYPLREVRRLAGDAMLYAEHAEPRELADHVVALARDPGLRIDLGQRLRLRAQELTWERSAEALLEVYSSLVGEG